MSSYVTVSGPFFDGRDEHHISAMCDSIAREVAREGQAIVIAFGNTSFKTQTPHYLTKIKLKDVGQHAVDVDDDRIIYGPWLEGVGSRNFPKTRFKGYATFRRTIQYLNRGPAEAIAQRVADRYVEQM